MFLENQLDNRDLLANINDNIFRSVLEQLFESTKYKSLFDRISENLFQNIKNVHTLMVLQYFCALGPGGHLGHEGLLLS